MKVRGLGHIRMLTAVILTAAGSTAIASGFAELEEGVYAEVEAYEVDHNEWQEIVLCTARVTKVTADGLVGKILLTPTGQPDEFCFQGRNGQPLEVEIHCFTNNTCAWIFESSNGNPGEEIVAVRGGAIKFLEYSSRRLTKI